MEQKIDISTKFKEIIGQQIIYNSKLEDPCTKSDDEIRIKWDKFRIKTDNLDELTVVFSWGEEEVAILEFHKRKDFSGGETLTRWVCKVKYK